MRMINELVVRGEPPEVAKLVQRFGSVPRDGWRREPEIEERLNGVGVAPRGAFCFSWQGTMGRPAASVILHKRGSGEISISNIVPVERRPLTDEEYNNILSGFDADVLRPMGDGLSVETLLVPPGVQLEKNLSSEARDALRAFSSTANKVAPHPLDWRRWDRFLVRSHLDHSPLDSSEIDWWLASEGWPEGRRGELVEAYEKGLSLLAEYDEERGDS